MIAKKIIYIQAVDWAIHHEQVNANQQFDVIHGEIVGFLVEETDTHIAIAQQWFTTGEVRQAVVVPKVYIICRMEIDSSQ